MIFELISTVIDKLFPDANQRADAKIRLIELQEKGELARIENELKSQTLVNETMRSEYASQDKFKSSWRPLFGYIMAVSFGLIVMAMVFALVQAILHDASAIKEILSSITELFFLGFTVLGISVYQRSQDKRILSGQTQTSVMEKLSQLLKK